MPFSRSSRIILVLAIDIIFFIVELVVGYAVGSLALVADSFHMLSDILSLVVALYAIKLTGKSSTAAPRFTYGWHRAEILAALVNGVFLLALCLSISLDAMERLFRKPEISEPRLIVIVGCMGLVSNIVGLFLFHEHGHSHGSSTPSHNDSSDEVHVPHRGSSIDAEDGAETPGTAFMEKAPLLDVGHSHSHSHSHDGDDHPAELESGDAHSHSHSHSHSHGGHSHGSMNMHALWLHVFGDCLGNIGVIATGLIIWLADWSGKAYCDPVISLIIAIIILSTALPLVRRTAFILLQGAPSDVDVEQVRTSIEDVSSVLSVHELHIWQLSENKVVASVHVGVSRKDDFMHTATQIRKVLHSVHGIHSCTIQPEYEDDSSRSLVESTTTCLLLCPADNKCDPRLNACCPPLDV